MVGIENMTGETFARGDALIVCSMCMDILVVGNACVGYVIYEDRPPGKDTCMVVYTKCDACTLMDNMTYDLAEDNMLCTEDNILYIAMLLGYDGVMMAYPEYLDISLAKVIIAPDSRVISAAVGVSEDGVLTAIPCQYVSGNFLQT